MDMLLLGETILGSGDNPNLYGFWMPAAGNNGVGAVEVFEVEVADAFEVRMETKSSDEDDNSATTVGTVVIDATTAKLYKFDVADARDLVRYRVKFAGSGTKFLHFQFAQPLWAPN